MVRRLVAKVFYDDVQDSTQIEWLSNALDHVDVADICQDVISDCEKIQAASVQAFIADSRGAE